MEHNYQQVPSSVALGEDDFVDLPLLEAVSPSMRAVVALVHELSQSHVPVLLIGEYGTGKQNLARTIHVNAGGSVERFLVRNCVDLTPEMLDSKVLGSAATLYLSEIGELNEESQERLLAIL